jgi:hypothetical protein
MVYKLLAKFPSEVIKPNPRIKEFLFALGPSELRELGRAIDKSPVKAPIFVVGSPRSGTTLLGNLLSQPSKVCSEAESMFLVSIWHIYSDYYLGGNKRGIARLKPFASNDHFLALVKNFSDGIISGILKSESDIFLDHTPWYGLMIPFLNILYPQLRVVHIIRDGRWVANSLKTSYEKGFGWGGSSTSERLQLWETATSEAISMAPILKERYHEIRYEELVNSPIDTLPPLFNSLGLDFEKEYLNLLEQPFASPSRSNFSSQYSRQPEGWTSEDEQQAQQICGDFMKKLGYLQE